VCLYKREREIIIFIGQQRNTRTVDYITLYYIIRVKYKNNTNIDCLALFTTEVVLLTSEIGISKSIIHSKYN